jgi:hypothetical protein
MAQIRPKNDLCERVRVSRIAFEFFQRVHYECVYHSTRFRRSLAQSITKIGVALPRQLKHSMSANVLKYFISIR